MDSRDLWEDQVERLTKKYARVYEKIESNADRIQYLENVVLTLIVALKSGGVISDSPDAEDKTYEF